MRAASIDIGTNSVLLLVAETTNGTLNVIEELLEVPRLGKGVDRDKTLHPDSQQRVLNVLKFYKTHLNKHYPSITPIVTATSAVRDASNRNEFLGLIKKETDWEVVLLSGMMEAETTFKGALSVLNSNASTGRSVVLDIGGGSTEIAVGMDEELDDSISLDMGSVRFSERFLTSNPPDRDQLRAAENEVQQLLKTVDFDRGEISNAIGVAGTVTSIAAIELGLKDYEPKQINGYLLKLSVIDRYIQEFSGMKASEIEQKYPVFLKNRGDVILAGLIILREFLKWISIGQIVVSTGGIRHGILLT